MARICHESPVPVALDEELIGVTRSDHKEALLRQIRPPYIILKPTLLGGFDHCREWIALAEKLGIGWWITSALESNIGLNAISQFTATFQPAMPQGLGTGQLYHNNIPSPLIIRSGFLRYEGEWRHVND
jgi:O-succinylbenzoate synthase